MTTYTKLTHNDIHAEMMLGNCILITPKGWMQTTNTIRAPNDCYLFNEPLYPTWTTREQYNFRKNVKNIWNDIFTKNIDSDWKPTW